MIGSAVFWPEQALHIAGKRTCRRNGNIAVAHKFIDDTECKRLIQAAGQFG